MAGEDGSDCCACMGSGIQANEPFEPPLPHAFQWLKSALHISHDTRESDHALHPLLILYALVLVLFLLFFCWEDAPWHGSQRIEERYLKFTIVLLFITTMVAWFSSPKDMYLGMSQSVNAVVMTAVLVHLWERHRKRLILPRFADFRVEGKDMIGHEVPKATPRALRAIRELDRFTLLLMNNDRLITSDTGVYLFILFMIIGGAVIELHTSIIPYAAHYIRYTFWLLAAVKAFQWGYSWYRSRPIKEGLKYRIRDTIGGEERSDQQTIEVILETVSVGSLMEVLDDDSKKTLVEGGLKDGLLSVRSKAILIDGLMKSGISHNDLHTQFVRRLILSCYGMELTKLKDLIDGGGNIYNLMKLLHYDMKDVKVRDQILAHIRAEAQHVREQKGRHVGIKLLSDVDDTLYCSGGKFPAGCDTLFPKSVVYPGCLSLFKALDGAGKEGISSCNLVFLSARPHLYKSIAEDMSYHLFRDLVQDGSMHSLPTLLPGHKYEGLEAMVTFKCRRSEAWRKVGELKYATYQKFVDMYREYDFMFFGDNGQGDLLAGQLMAGMGKEPSRARKLQKQLSRQLSRSFSKRSPGANLEDSMRHDDEEEPSLRPGDGPRLRAVLIHQVLDPQESLAMNAPAKRDEAWVHSLEDHRIIHHRSYVGAALGLYRLDPELLSAAQLADIVRQAAEDLNEARIMYPEWGNRWTAAEDDLRADVDAAEEALQGLGMGDLPTIASTRTFLMGHCITWPEMSSTSDEESESSSDDSAPA